MLHFIPFVKKSRLMHMFSIIQNCTKKEEYFFNGLVYGNGQRYESFVKVKKTESGFQCDLMKYDNAYYPPSIVIEKRLYRYELTKNDVLYPKVQHDFRLREKQQKKTTVNGLMNELLAVKNSMVEAEKTMLQLQKSMKQKQQYAMDYIQMYELNIGNRFQLKEEETLTKLRKQQKEWKKREVELLKALKKA